MKNPQENLAILNIWSRNVTTSTRETTTRAWIYDVRMAQFVLKIEKLSHIMGPRGSQDSRSPSPIMAPDTNQYEEKHYLHTNQHQLNANQRPGILQYFKVAEHSFSARFCWCKLARAQGFQKTNMPSTERSFHLLNTRTICVIFLYNCMQCIYGVSILLQRYVTKGKDAKNPAFLAFVCYRKNPVKCNACAVARKIETDCFSRNVPFSSDPVVRISRNLAKK